MAEPPGDGDTERRGSLSSADLPPARRRQSWGQVLLIIALGLGLVLLVVAHLTGAIGPGLHGPVVTTSPSGSVTQTVAPSGAGR
jgi:hypothetical protein